MKFEDLTLILCGQLSKLPEGGTLLVPAQTQRAGVAWHHHALFELIRLRASINGEPLSFTTTPSRWHEQAGAWSWILFEAALTPRNNENCAIVEIESILPGSVNIETRVWLELVSCQSAKR